MTDLLGCPFCGGEAKRFTIGADEPSNAGGDVISCTRCGASSHVEFGRKENLISRWNTRPQLQSTEAVERVARIIDPASWEVMDSYLADARRKWRGQNVMWPVDRFKDKASMAKAREIITSLTSPAVVEDPHKVCPACMEPECDFDCDGPYDEAVLITPANKEGA